MNHSTAGAEPSGPFFSLHQAGAKVRAQMLGGAGVPGGGGAPSDPPQLRVSLQEGRTHKFAHSPWGEALSDPLIYSGCPSPTQSPSHMV